MGCGSSKTTAVKTENLPPEKKKSKKVGLGTVQESRNQDDLIAEDVEDYSHKEAKPTQDPKLLLSSWDQATRDPAHARIIHTVDSRPLDKEVVPRSRVKFTPKISSASKSEDQDSSDDEPASPTPAPQGEPSIVSAPGMITDHDKPNLLHLFRPRTPAVMDLD
eukprot:m.109616 g.109616  ORF g.109616 m.109616 type:complete len:163 (-) comp14008_c0_seq1:2648-3136(-)